MRYVTTNVTVLFMTLLVGCGNPLSHTTPTTTTGQAERTAVPEDNIAPKTMPSPAIQTATPKGNTPTNDTYASHAPPTAKVIDLAELLRDYDSPNLLAADAKHLNQWYEFKTSKKKTQAPFAIDREGDKGVIGFLSDGYVYPSKSPSRGQTIPGVRVNCFLNDEGTKKALTITDTRKPITIRGKFSGVRRMSWPYGNLSLAEGGFLFKECDIILP